MAEMAYWEISEKTFGETSSGNLEDIPNKSGSRIEWKMILQEQFQVKKKYPEETSWVILEKRFENSSRPFTKYLQSSPVNLLRSFNGIL